MRDLFPIAAYCCESIADAYEKRMRDTKEASLVGQVEAAVASGSIDVNLLEKFKKLVAGMRKSHQAGAFLYSQMVGGDFNPIGRLYPDLGNTAWAGDDAGAALRALGAIDYDKVAEDVRAQYMAMERKPNQSVEEYVKSNVQSQRLVIDSLVSYWELYRDMLALRVKAKDLPAVGEIVKKEKPSVAVPTSKYFKSFDFLKWYTPKGQQAVVDVVPDIDFALDSKEGNAKDIRKWDAIFNKHDKVKSLGVRAYDLHRQEPKSYGDSDKSVLAVLGKDFAPVRAVFDLIDDLEVKSSKEREASALIRRDWTPAADMLKDRLEGIIKDVIVALKASLFKWDMQDSLTTWETVRKTGAKTYEEFYQWSRKNKEDARWIGPRHRDMFDNGGRGKLYDKFPQSEIEKLAKEDSESQGDAIAKHFISKNIYKLTSLLKKRKITDIRVHRVDVPKDAISSLMKFSFDDGSSFDVRNQIVWSHSPLGKAFARYPTTFHNVVVAGVAMPSPSEVKVYKAFSDEPAPKPDTEDDVLESVEIRDRLFPY